MSNYSEDKATVMPKIHHLVLLTACALTACSEEAHKSAAPLKPSVAVAAPPAAILPPTLKAPAESASPAADILGWRSGLYYIRNRPESKSCEAKLEGQMQANGKVDPTWICISQDQYKAACERLTGFHRDAINWIDQNHNSEIAANLRSGNYRVEFSWGFVPRSSREGCAAKVFTLFAWGPNTGRPPEMREVTYRVDSFHVSQTPGKVVASDVSP